MPLAAAAAIGVVAIGLVQLSPPEQPALDTTSSARRPAEQILEDKSRVASVAEAPAAAPAPAANEPTDALRKQKAAGEGAAPTGAPRADANTNAVAPKVAPAASARAAGVAREQARRAGARTVPGRNPRTQGRNGGRQACP
jgi:2-oxoglutarate dehydrogenase E2 component (dihydrolipoamide succinyltransferase)